MQKLIEGGQPEEVVHARNVIASLCGRGHQAFVTEAVSLGELFHEEALFGLTGVRKVGVPRGRLFPSGLCLSAISLVVCAWPDPLPTGLKMGMEKMYRPYGGRS